MLFSRIRGPIKSARDSVTPVLPPCVSVKPYDRSWDHTCLLNESIRLVPCRKKKTIRRQTAVYPEAAQTPCHESVNVLFAKNQLLCSYNAHCNRAAEREMGPVIVQDNMSKAVPSSERARQLRIAPSQTYCTTTTCTTCCAERRSP